MVAEVILGWVWVEMQHESGNAQFAGQQHLCLFCWWLLLDALLGQWPSAVGCSGRPVSQQSFLLWVIPFYNNILFGAWSLVLFSFSLASPAHLVPWSPSFTSFSPLTYVYNMCKCGGGVTMYSMLTKYPKKSPLFLGSWQTTPICNWEGPQKPSNAREELVFPSANSPFCRIGAVNVRWGGL